MITFWFERDYIAYIHNLLGIDDFKDYNDDIKQGTLENEGLLSKLNNEFVIGKEEIFKSEDEKKVLIIKDHSSYPSGLILSPYSKEDIYQDKSLKYFEVIELIGTDTKPFLQRVFNTYKEMVKKTTDKEKKLLVYNIPKIKNKTFKHIH